MAKKFEDFIKESKSVSDKNINSSELLGLYQGYLINISAYIHDRFKMLVPDHGISNVDRFNCNTYGFRKDEEAMISFKIMNPTHVISDDPADRYFEKIKKAEEVFNALKKIIIEELDLYFMVKNTDLSEMTITLDILNEYFYKKEDFLKTLKAVNKFNL